MDVYPVHLFDNADDYRKLFMSYIFVFNDVLDAQKLSESLSALLETGDWRKLGGRLRTNVRHVSRRTTVKQTRLQLLTMSYSETW